MEPYVGPREIHWYWGPPGCGKSRKIWDCINELKVPMSDIYLYRGGRFLDGYDNQPVAVFDDFRLENFSYSMLLKITDRYPCAVETKGSSAVWNAKTIFFSCPNCPMELSCGEAENPLQLARRITILLGEEELSKGRGGNTNPPLDNIL